MRETRHETSDDRDATDDEYDRRLETVEARLDRALRILERIEAVVARRSDGVACVALVALALALL